MRVSKASPEAWMAYTYSRCSGVKDVLRSRKSAARKQRDEAPDDAFGSLGVKLLIGNRAHQRFERRATDLWPERARADLPQEFPHHGINFAKIRYGRVGVWHRFTERVAMGGPSWS